MSYFDAHLHLISQDCLNKAQQAGVLSVICNATHPRDWDKVIDFSLKNKGVYACVGVHPWFVNDLEDDWLLKLEALLIKMPHLMIGEIGIDTTKPYLEKQKDVFFSCLKLAQKYHRIAHIHGHKSWDIIASYLKDFPDLTVLLHRYKGSEQQTKKLLTCCNCYFSLMDKKSLLFIPAQKVLVETDSPDGLKDPIKIKTLVNELGLNDSFLEDNFNAFLLNQMKR